MPAKKKIKSIIDQLKQAAPDLFSKYPILFAYIYGSFAKGDIHPFSDLDIGVFLQPQLADQHLKTELSLALDIDEFLDHAVESDVRSINSMPITLIGNILTDGLLIYSRDESARVDFEVGMRKKYFDFIHVMKNYHKHYVAAQGLRSQEPE